MREILFRGKTEISERWVVGDLLHWRGDDMCICEEYNSTEKKQYAVIPETVGQYIGFNDKNGTRIFECDIVNDEQSGYNYFIKWFPEYACFSLANKNGNMEFGCDEFEIFLNDLIVIGNIYDNPEFLKVGEEE